VPLRELAQPLIDFVFSPVCLACDMPSATAPLCPSCETKLLAIEAHPSCPLCGKPLPAGAACGWCKGKGVPHLDRILSLGPFDDPLRPLIHHMKYRHRWPLAEHLAERLHARPDVRALLANADCLVPVPLHWHRQVGRGYNQSHVLAAHLQKRSGKPVLRSAVRVRATPTQTGMVSRTARAANLRDAFAVRRPESVHGKHLILIDDVFTTGATLLSLARTLRHAQPASMSALVIAVADAHHSDFTRR
jgi:ComF family protein